VGEVWLSCVGWGPHLRTISMQLSVRLQTMQNNMEQQLVASGMLHAGPGNLHACICGAAAVLTWHSSADVATAWPPDNSVADRVQVHCCSV
jgi:hypothetical protein